MQEAFRSTTVRAAAALAAVLAASIAVGAYLALSSTSGVRRREYGVRVAAAIAVAPNDCMKSVLSRRYGDVFVPRDTALEKPGGFDRAFYVRLPLPALRDPRQQASATFGFERLGDKTDLGVSAEWVGLPMEEGYRSRLAQELRAAIEPILRECVAGAPVRPPVECTTFPQGEPCPTPW